jgi:hypothetical protein
MVGKDGTSSGWMSSDGSTLGACVGKYAADWRTVDYRAGDVVALSIDVFHMSAANCTDCIRVSCDTRWQPVRRPACLFSCGRHLPKRLRLCLDANENA